MKISKQTNRQTNKKDSFKIIDVLEYFISKNEESS
jgi:hypothetical protein